MDWLGVSYDKGIGFCVMRYDTYKNKQLDLLNSNQFSGSKRAIDSIATKIENEINKKLLAMRKKHEVNGISTQGGGLLGEARQALWVGKDALIDYPIEIGPLIIAW